MPNLVVIRCGKTLNYRAYSDKKFMIEAEFDRDLLPEELEELRCDPKRFEAKYSPPVPMVEPDVPPAA